MTSLKKKRQKLLMCHRQLRCSFCHKSQDAVELLISSPSEYPRAYICDECVGVCVEIISEARAKKGSAGG